MDVAQTVKQAIQALNSPSETQRANDWLVDFEKSSQCWTVADHLLHDGPGTPYRFFGAKFLYSKIQRQFDELDLASSQALTGSLVAHLVRLSSEAATEWKVVRYICLAIAAMAVQLAQPNTVQSILGHLNPVIPTNPSIVVVLLSLLPEEGYNRQINTTYEKRDFFLNELKTASENVFAFLVTILQQIEGNGSSAKAQDEKVRILRCLENWIDIVDIDINTLHKYSILSYICSRLCASQGEEFECLCELVVVCMKRYRPINKNHGTAVPEEGTFTTLLSYTLLLLPKWSELLSHLQRERYATFEEIDEEVMSCARALVRIFTEAAEQTLYMYQRYQTLPHPSEGSNGEGRGGEFITLCKVLLGVGRVPLDPNIIRIPLKFFYDLSLALVPLDNAGDDGGWDEGYDNNNGGAGAAYAPPAALVLAYKPLYYELLEIATFNIQIPPAILTSGTNEATPSSLPCYIQESRDVWRECILDCLAVVGGAEGFEWGCRGLESRATALSSQTTPNNQAWSEVEALLFTLSITLQRLNPLQPHPYLPQLLPLLCSLPTHLLYINVSILNCIASVCPHLHDNLKHTYVFIERVVRHMLPSARTSTPAFSALQMQACKTLLSILQAHREHRPLFSLHPPPSGMPPLPPIHLSALPPIPSPLFAPPSTSPPTPPSLPTLLHLIFTLSACGVLGAGAGVGAGGGDEAEGFVWEGVGVALSNSPPALAVPLAEEVFGFFNRNVRAYLQAAGNNGNGVNGNVDKCKKEVNSSIQSLTIFMKHLHVSFEEETIGKSRGPVGGSLASPPPGSAPTNPLIQRLLSCACESLTLFNEALVLFPSESLSEKTGRGVRALLKHYPCSLLHMLPQIMQMIVSQFERLPYSSFLYCASTLVSTYSLSMPISTPLPPPLSTPLLPLLYTLTFALTGAFFQHLPNISAFVEKPSVVEEFYFYMAKVLQYIPHLWVNGSVPVGGNVAGLSLPVFDANRQREMRTYVLQAAAGALVPLEHRDARKGIILFCERYFSLATYWRDSTPQSDGGKLHVLAREMVLKDDSGGLLFSALLALIVGGEAREGEVERVADICASLRRKNEEVLKHWLSVFFNSLPPNVRDAMVSQSIPTTLLTCRSGREMEGVLYKMGDVGGRARR